MISSMNVLQFFIKVWTSVEVAPFPRTLHVRKKQRVDASVSGGSPRAQHQQNSMSQSKAQIPIKEEVQADKIEQLFSCDLRKVIALRNPPPRALNPADCPPLPGPRAGQPADFQGFKVNYLLPGSCSKWLKGGYVVSEVEVRELKLFSFEDIDTYVKIRNSILYTYRLAKSTNTEGFIWLQIFFP